MNTLTDTDSTPHISKFVVKGKTGPTMQLFAVCDKSEYNRVQLCIFDQFFFK